ncbi:sterol desaturase family protein, partial [bacterium]|nr:sterol desaturase family protein [bacterium]
MTLTFVLISLSFVVLERLLPWRKAQALLRKGWLTDLAHITFNGYLFQRYFYSALALYAAVHFSQYMEAIGMWDVLNIAVMQGKPLILQFLCLFFIQDFLKWCVHNLLHRIPFLWQFHKVHHSVQVMDWIGNMRYHWMEVIVYNSILYIPLSFLGFHSSLFYYVGVIEIVVGHFNHSNINFDTK